MLPSAPSTFKVRTAYFADINKLSYFQLMPMLQKRKCTEISARWYLILEMINGTWSICEEPLICIILALFIWSFLHNLFHSFSGVLHQSQDVSSSQRLPWAALVQKGSQMKAEWSKLSRKAAESEAPMCEPKWTQVGFQIWECFCRASSYKNVFAAVSWRNLIWVTVAVNMQPPQRCLQVISLRIGCVQLKTK